MTDAELRSAILANPTVLQLVKDGDDYAAASELCNILPAEVRTTRVNYMDISVAPGAANIIRRLIATIDAAASVDPLVAEARHWLRSPTGLDVGHPLTRQMLDFFGGSSELPLTVEDAATIKGLAEFKPNITYQDVARVMRQNRIGGKVGEANWQETP
jgi:hypothetical protein